MGISSISHSIISPLGIGTAQHAERLLAGQIAITRQKPNTDPNKDYFGAVIQDEIIKEAFSLIGKPMEFTKLEKMALISAVDSLSKAPEIDIASKKTIVIFSTTKGNIDLIENGKPIPKKAFLWNTASLLGIFLGNPNPVITVSNACISGTMAIILASRLLRQNKYEHAVIIGADLFSPFVHSGFQAFQAVSSAPCKPFDANRTGITLGEAAATLILSKTKSENHRGVQVLGGATSNDANHISGPSRTGDGLYYAIEAALKDSDSNFSLKIDYISAHGTGTAYNDEMESKALAWAGLTHVPLNSLKGYFGHTLGTSGVLESILAIDSLENNRLYASAGFSELGVSEHLNVLTKNQFNPISTCLKTSSGFGSCNAAVIFSKDSR
jgi:3-oxoacyl-[acyl-carrier-protein] synthase-1